MLSSEKKVLLRYYVAFISLKNNSSTITLSSVIGYLQGHTFNDLKYSISIDQKCLQLEVLAGIVTGPEVSAQLNY